jgi:hypothetical protein
VSKNNEKATYNDDSDSESKSARQTLSYFGMTAPFLYCNVLLSNLYISDAQRTNQLHLSILN